MQCGSQKHRENYFGCQLKKKTLSLKLSMLGSFEQNPFSFHLIKRKSFVLKVFVVNSPLSEGQEKKNEPRLLQKYQEVK